MPQRWSFHAGSFRGVPIRIHSILLLLLCGPIVHSALSEGWRAGSFVAALLILALGCVVLHEFAHTYAAHRFGMRVHALILGPYLNGAILEKDPESPALEWRIALAGPLCNALLLLLFLVLRWLLPWAHAPRMTIRCAEGLALVNLFLCLGNLLPAFPLDGGRILRALLGVRLPLLVATRLTVRIGNVVALALPALSLLHPTVRASLLLWIVAAGVSAFLAISGRREERHVLVREIYLQATVIESELSQDIQAELCASDLAPRQQAIPSYRPLPPGQFRHWKTLAEAAFRREHLMETPESPETPGSLHQVVGAPEANK